MGDIKILHILNFLIPICYMMVGFLLLTDFFATIHRGHRILFGLIVMGYGVFRLRRAWRKMRDKV